MDLKLKIDENHKDNDLFPALKAAGLNKKMLKSSCEICVF
ncbi:hypothetical protein SAMN04487906_1995 [Zhouia amylolytica]|uniref:Uncharacterized protein n=2 Tax=Zhouia amylolytica TaxID=376730 RepID=W2UQA3_9FLAO|nr:hypothetical protein P278_08310 [Zhouia amylolytica AD3]SFS87440.1 hypothetical protein SAMN04487906_1995 [Zhouia amylolytica]